MRSRERSTCACRKSCPAKESSQRMVECPTRPRADGRLPKSFVLFVVFVVSSFRQRISDGLTKDGATDYCALRRYDLTAASHRNTTPRALKVEGQRSIRKHGALRTAWSGMRAFTWDLTFQTAWSAKRDTQCSTITNRITGPPSTQH